MTNFSGKQILLVDDEPAILDSIKTGLEMRGAVVTIARNGLSAIKLIEESVIDFDCVITDFQMPLKTGAEVAACCEEHLIPCVVCSGDHSNDVRIKGLKAVFLAKPFNYESLSNSVELTEKAWESFHA
jgi:DNA-binding response OmpR family regulator